MHTSINDRFWEYVDKNGLKPAHVPELDNCWVWTGGKSGKAGYGTISFRGKKCVSSRVSWILHNGEIPQGMCVLHKCDNPPCVNPNHLFLGTHLDNTRDMIKKGRAKLGGRKKEEGFDPLRPKAVFPALFYCYRKTQKKTLSHFAAELGISTPTLWRLEKGKQIDGQSMGKLLLWLFGK